MGHAMIAVYVAKSDLGLGVFARQAFAIGDEILRFCGPVISLDEALAKGEEQGNTFQIGDALYLDLERPGVLVNHSCEPNTGVVEDRILVALRPISQGEEIRFDYSTTMWDGCWTMRCRCGSSKCRGLVSDFPELPAELRAEYLRLCVVQEFIVRRLRGASPAAPGTSCEAQGKGQ